MDSTFLSLALRGAAGAEVHARHRRLVGSCAVFRTVSSYGAVGLCSLVLFFVFITHSDVLAPGEDAEQPLAIIFAPFLINICYTAGWFVEIISRVLFRERIERLGPLLLKLGFGFSLFVALLPSVYWGIYWLLFSMQIIHHTPKA